MFFKKKADPKLEGRIPPGQHLTRKWPVLHVGQIPAFDRATWRFQTSGLVEQPLDLDWKSFGELPQVDLQTDFHCVTTWSKLDMVWRGVPIRELLARTRPKGARHVIIHSHGGYTTNLPFDVLDDEDVMLATGCDGEDLTPEHGYPLRLVVPKRYAWKSAKWLSGLEFSATDKPGFWELRGYHNNAEPFAEERFG